MAATNGSTSMKSSIDFKALRDLSSNIYQLDSISEWIFYVRVPGTIGHRTRIANRDYSSFPQRSQQSVVIRATQSRMRLFRRTKISFNA
jgi:hypothetical protein